MKLTLCFIQVFLNSQLVPHIVAEKMKHAPPTLKEAETLLIECEKQVGKKFKNLF